MDRHVAVAYLYLVDELKYQAGAIRGVVHLEGRSGVFRVKGKGYRVKGTG